MKPKADSKWRQALDRWADTWEGLTAKERQERYDKYVQEGTNNDLVQKNIIYWSDKENGRKRNRAMYAKHAEQRALDARIARQKIKNNPEALLKYRLYCRERARRRIETDLNFLLRKKLRTRIGMALKHYVKSASTEELTGCSFDELKRYIEARFQRGMTWGNYGRGGWHIDHILPCQSFDLSDPHQQRECFHFTNLQPMWQRDNLSKGARQIIRP